MAHNGPMKRLKEIAEVLSGILPPKGPDLDAAYVQIKDLRDPGGDLLRGPAPRAKRATKIAPDDLLVPSRGDEITAFRPGPHLIGAFVGLDVYLIRPARRHVYPDFLLVALNDLHTIRQLKASATGGALPRIPKQALEDVLVPLPPMDEQRSIGRIGALAAACEGLQRQRMAAESKLNAALISRLLRTAA